MRLARRPYFLPTHLGTLFRFHVLLVHHATSMSPTICSQLILAHTATFLSSVEVPELGAWLCICRPISSSSTSSSSSCPVDVPDISGWSDFQVFLRDGVRLAPDLFALSLLSHDGGLCHFNTKLTPIRSSSRYQPKLTRPGQKVVVRKEKRTRNRRNVELEKDFREKRLRL